MNRSPRLQLAAFAWMLAALTSVASAQSAGEAMYEVTFEATWSSITHPGVYPAGAHFSQPIGVAHDANVSFWEPGELASAGIEDMAETGSTSPLDDEIDAAIQAGTALERMIGAGISSPGSTTFTLRVDTDRLSD